MANETEAYFKVFYFCKVFESQKIFYKLLIAFKLNFSLDRLFLIFLTSCTESLVFKSVPISFSQTSLLTASLIVSDLFEFFIVYKFSQHRLFPCLPLCSRSFLIQQKSDTPAQRAGDCSLANARSVGFLRMKICRMKTVAFQPPVKDWMEYLHLKAINSL